MAPRSLGLWGETHPRRCVMRSLTAYAVLYLFYALAAYVLSQMLMARLSQVVWQVYSW